MSFFSPNTHIPRSLLALAFRSGERAGLFGEVQDTPTSSEQGGPKETPAGSPAFVEEKNDILQRWFCLYQVIFIYYFWVFWGRLFIFPRKQKHPDDRPDVTSTFI